MSTLQEKLEQRAQRFDKASEISAKPQYLLVAEFARAELQKAADIAEMRFERGTHPNFREAGLKIAREIRALME